MTQVGTRRLGAGRVLVVVLVVVAVGVGTVAYVLARHAGTSRRGAGVPSTATGSPVVTASPGGVPVAIGPSFLGVDGESLRNSNCARVWNNPALPSEVAALGVQNLRMFGGTTANFWDWRAGRTTSVLEGGPGGITAGVPVQQPIPFSSLAAAARAAQGTAVFDVNMLTSTLADQEAMLHAAQTSGLPVRYVELGNELYVGAPAYRAAFPDGAAYAQVANPWIAALHRDFPGVRVAVVGADVQGSAGHTGRWTSWNREVLAAVHGADAMTFHTYLDPAIPAGASVADPAALSAVFGQARARQASLTEDLDLLPPGMRAWVTEWNVQAADAPVSGTWAQGLTDAAYALLLARDPRIELTDIHALLSGAEYGLMFCDTHGFAPTADAAIPSAGPTTAMTRSAAGAAMATVWSAMAGNGTAQALDLGVADAGGAVLAQAYTGGPHPAVLVVNTTARPVTVALPASLGRGWVTAATSAAPSMVVVRAANLNRSTSAVSPTVTVPAYAVASARAS